MDLIMSESPGSVMLSTDTTGVIKHLFRLNTSYLLGFSTFSRHGSDNVRISRISDAQHRHAEILSTSSSQLDVVPCVMMNTCLGQHGVVLDLTLAELWCVGADDDQLCFALSKCFQRASVPEGIFPTFHDESQSGVNALASLLLDWSHL